MLPAFAQSDDASTQRVEITGSAIKRIDAETSVPVTVIKVDDLKQAGVTSIEEVISRLAASQSSVGTSQSVGAGTGGAAFADLRGLGANKTLILLNGRRIADNAIDGSAPDLNMIPFAALDRIEILRDGASALYGTDAIGGVINFITKKSLQGGSISAEYSSPQHSGGKSDEFNIGYGYGDLDTQGFNILGFLDYQKQHQILATQRSFGATGYLPGYGVSKSSGNSSPANYSYVGTDGNFHSANADAPGCASSPNTFTLNGVTCRYDYTSQVQLIPDTERISGMLKGTMKVAQQELGLEYFYTQSTNKTYIAGVPYAGLTVNPGTQYFPGGGITPAPTGVPIDPTQPVSVSWRAVDAGGRQGKTDNSQQRALATLDGTVVGWDYSAGLSYNENKITDKITGGYTNDDIITTDLANGTINPFAAGQDSVGAAAIASSLVTGNLQTAKGQTYDGDFHASREVGDWLHAGHQAALALGAEYRREKFSDVANVPIATLVQSSSGFDPNTDNTGSRNVYAGYGELNVPILSNLDVTAAVRYDHYSDVGATTNPKASFRFQPMTQLLVRGSYTTGFRAPSLYELNQPTEFTDTANDWNDPVQCPTDPNTGQGVAAPGQNEAAVCNTQFLLRTKGNSALKPEKSKSWTLGFVLEPIRGTSVGLDFWWIRLQHSIGALPEELIFDNPTKYSNLFVRNGTGNLSVNGADCPGSNCGYIDDELMNLGGVNTNGVDLSVNSRLRTGYGTFAFDANGTYVTKYEYQQEEGGEWLQNAGVYSGSGPIFRWQHTAAVTWSYDKYTVGLVNRFKSGYQDQNDPAQVDPDFLNHHVGSYSLFDLFGSYAPIKTVSLTLGVRNLTDKQPPFSNQGATFQQGYDPRYTDPTGRAYYARATYSF